MQESIFLLHVLCHRDLGPAVGYTYLCLDVYALNTNIDLLFQVYSASLYPSHNV